MFYLHLGKNRLVYKHVKGSQYRRRRRARGNNSRYGRFVLLLKKLCHSALEQGSDEKQATISCQNGLRFSLLRIKGNSLKTYDSTWMGGGDDCKLRPEVATRCDFCNYLAKEKLFLSGKSPGILKRDICGNHVVKLRAHVHVVSKGWSIVNKLKSCCVSWLSSFVRYRWMLQNGASCQGQGWRKWKVNQTSFVFLFCTL